MTLSIAVLRAIALSVVIYFYYAECRYDECRYAECRYDGCCGASLTAGLNPHTLESVVECFANFAMSVGHLKRCL
jgi:hypothetical protein